MTAPTFSPAKREAIRLLIGVAGGTGSGKTYSALRMARGLAGDASFCLIDTENGRALHYADEFSFDHADLEPPFTSERYLETIQAADAAGYPVIVVDSASHEYAGTGGLLDYADAELERMGGAASAKLASFVKPKEAHRKYRNELLRLRAHVILCYRAEPKVEMRKDAGGKWEIIPKPSLVGLDGWIPIAEKNDPYELTVSFLLTADAPGIPKPIKLPDRLRELVPLDAPLSEGVGAALGQWAHGSSAPEVASSPPVATESSPGPEPATLSAEQSAKLDELWSAIPRERLSLEQIIAVTAESRRLPADQMIALMGAKSFQRLRDSFSPLEAEAMIARLSDFKRKLDAVEGGS